MKIKLFRTVVVLSVIFLNSCKKQEIKTTPIVSLLITNAVIGGTNLQFGTNVATVANNTATPFGVLAGSQSIKLVSADPPNAVYYDQATDFVSGGVYSLFLTGIPDAVEPVMIKEENIIPHANNVFGVRVINLSPNGASISVNLLNEANGSLFPGIAYKTIADFIEVSAIAEEGDKTFEFRNATTGDLITSFVVPGYDMPRFRNITLAFVGNNGNETVFRINNY